tara:strand:- start:364 stop:1692 length:1329 start_codon:yes stop_codon:yes gene_type:complete
MKKTMLFHLIVLYLSASCSKSNDNPKDSNVELSPTSFNIILEEVNDESATIVWTASNDPENRTISYSIYLDDELIVDKTAVLTYTWEGLSAETSYNVKIVASNGDYNTTAIFTFTTKKYVPLVFDGDMILSSQEEVIAFGNQNYSEITGSLLIRDSGKLIDFFITDLTPLNNLTKIGGDFTIANNQRLENLEGLGNLKTIGGQFKIDQNYRLSSIQGLKDLVMVGGNLNVKSNSKLSTLEGLNKLNIIGQSIEIGGNALDNLRGLSGLTSIGQNLLLAHSSVTSLEGLENITEIQNNFEIRNCSLIQSLAGLDNLSIVKWRIQIQNNSALINLVGLEKLKEVGSSFNIDSNASLLNLKGLEALTVVNQGFLIMNNPELINLDALTKLSFIGWDLNITYNYSLTNFCGIRNFLIKGGPVGNLSTNGNSYEPGSQQIIDGNCSK